MKNLRRFFRYAFVFGTIVAFCATLWKTNAIATSFSENSRWNSFIQQNDTIPNDTLPDTDLPYPFSDEDGNTFNNKRRRSGLYLKPPTNINDTVEYDSKTNEYVVRKKLGDKDYRPPQTMTPDEYFKYDFDRAMKKHWQRQVGSSEDENGRKKGSSLIPTLYIKGELFESIFGSNTIEIKPQGNATLTFGLKINKIEDPSQPEDLQTNITFDFHEQIQMGVTGKIGTKMEVGINYNTEATFDFENQAKISYKGDEDDIIKEIEAGNVSMPLSGSLISGSQTLFGIKTKMQFGKLFVTSIFSQQKGETKTMEIKGGAQINEFEIEVDDYDANRHFFVGHYFRDHYEDALKTLPTPTSNINITNIEVWVTNRSGNYDNARNIVAVLDLAEGNSDKCNKDNDFNIVINNSVQYPDNTSNNVYRSISSGVRSFKDINSFMKGEGFILGKDFEKIEKARKLSPNEYSYNSVLGYISLNTALNADEVLGVAFEYNVNGKNYKVGELTANNTVAENTLILKMLKGTNLTPRLKNWDLMMKNIYSLNAYQVSEEDFDLQIMYRNDKTGTPVNNLSVGNIKDKTLLAALGLDKLNSQEDRGSDGFFDFLEGYTVNSTKGKIIFPVLEPFGENLEKIIGTPDAKNYTFNELYDSTLTKAKLMSSKNKFFLKGEYQSSSSSEIYLNAMNIPRGGVKVTGGGAILTEDVDYTVDYTIGRVTILNQGLLQSGQAIKITTETNKMFSIGTKTLLGTHLDYKFSDEFNIGATIMNLSERPLTHKVNIGNEPINNTIWGLNTSYSTEVPFLTKLVDKIPFIDTKEKSSITFEGEFAQILPGTNDVVGNGGIAYLDDFEGSKTTSTIGEPYEWILASRPQEQKDIFPVVNDLEVGYGRAKMAWYNILSDYNRENSSLGGYSKDEKSDHRAREVYEQDLFPDKDFENQFPTPTATLNLSYYPEERGPYNYETENINDQGKFIDPESRWAGIMRKVTTTDFEAANIEFIEFWMMDPFEGNYFDENTELGQEPVLYFNLGDISEDILRDSRKSFENGLPKNQEEYDNNKNLAETTWGYVPNTSPLNRAFENDPKTRKYQDVGLDGMDDEREKKKFAEYLQNLPAGARSKAEEDPSSDNCLHFRNNFFDQENAKIFERYKFINGTENNSPTNSNQIATRLPDIEDINQDNTLNENEAYYQYKISLKRQDFIVGKNFITDIIEDGGTRANKQKTSIKWYQFKIPIRTQNKQKFGEIDDFKSIRFMRMFMRGFDKEAILRLVKFNLVRSDWRQYDQNLVEAGEDNGVQSEGNTEFNVSVVNIEENGSRKPVNYVLPLGIDRATDPTNQQHQELNEQSLSMQVTNLQDGDARGTYKTLNLDVRQYKKLQMEIHAEALPEETLEEKDLYAFIRLGSDLSENYYEYIIPLKNTEHNEGHYSQSSNEDRLAVWPEENRVDLYFSELQKQKQKRNEKIRSSYNTGQYAITKIFTSEELPDGRFIRIKGNPNLSNVRVLMIGVRNPKNGGLISQTGEGANDLGNDKSGEVWFNELRLAEFNEESSWAATGRLITKFADFANVTISGGVQQAGFGSIEQKLNERSQDEIKNYDVTANFELGKFFPKNFGVKIPMFIGYSEKFVSPRYNPLDPDLDLEFAEDSIQDMATSYTRQKSINFTGVKINPKSTKKTKDGKKKRNTKKLWSISNWTTSYSFSETFRSDMETKTDLRRQHMGSLNYNYSKKPKNYTPFRNVRFLRSPMFRIIRDFNFYLMPNLISFRTSLDRDYHERELRNLTEGSVSIDPSYQKDFNWNRNYELRYDLSRGLKLSFSANNKSRIDEPYGKLDEDDPYYQEKVDTVWTNLKRLGRTTNYDHKVEAKYTVPINKLPLLDWVNMNATYTGNYYWETKAQNNDSINTGNEISNSNNQNLNTQFNLNRLYMKSDYLKKINNKYKKGAKPPKPKYEDVTHEVKKVNLKAQTPRVIRHNLKTIEGIRVKAFDKNGKTIKGTLFVVDKNKIKYTTLEDYIDITIQVNGKKEIPEPFFKMLGERTVFMLMGIKNVGITYNEQNGTTLPGYNPNTQIIGLSSQDGRYAPGFPFVFGLQNRNFINEAGEYGWLTTDTAHFNESYTMQHTNTLKIKSTIEPIAGLKIDLFADRSYSKNLTERYKATQSGEIYNLKRFALNETGRFSMSFNTISTAFETLGESSNNFKSDAFDEFLKNRTKIADRLSKERQKSFSSYDPNSGGNYPQGYSESSQDVLIPAFLAAYSGKSSNDISLDLFRKIPIPNWRVTFDGLTEFKFFKRHFKNVILSHGYSSIYSIGNFQSNTSYLDGNVINGFSDGIGDIETKLFAPEYTVNDVNITESFRPLIGVDFTWLNGITTKFSYNTKRNLSLNLGNQQLREGHEKEFRLTAGYRIKNLQIIQSKLKKPKDSDLILKFTFAYIRDLTLLRTLNTEVVQASNGADKINIELTADYKLQENLNIQAFYKHSITTPAISTSFPMSNINFGLSLMFTLVP